MIPVDRNTSAIHVFRPMIQKTDDVNYSANFTVIRPPSEPHKVVRHEIERRGWWRLKISVPIAPQNFQVERLISGLQAKISCLSLKL